jgi:sulfite exporter TauE/SafE
MTIAWAVLGVAVFTGLLGGVHCMGMCGGIVSALSGVVRGPRAPATPWSIPLAYNLGRITSYAIAGAIAGAVGSLGLMLEGLLPVQIALYVMANLLLIGLGLYLAGVPGPIARIERLGSHLWARVKPHTRRFLPLDTLPKAFAVGMLWGWLPCGLVYTVLFGALLSGDALSGAVLMLAFGLGTLPNLMAAALVLRRSRAWLSSRPARLVSGSVVLGFGVWGLAHATTLGQQIKGGLICIG